MERKKGKGIDMRSFILYLFCFFTLSFIFPTTIFGKAMFWDDFEQDKLGEEPSKWKKIAGKGKGEIIKDPKDPTNKVFSMPDRYVAGPRPGGGFYMVGDKTWKDYAVEWEWMPADGYHGMVFWYNDEEHYYLADKRGGEGIINLYIRDAAPMWTQFATGPFVWEANKWYSARLVINGKKVILKIKEKSNDTPFEKIKVAKSGIEGEDEKYSSGGFCNGGKGLIDNVIIGRTVNDLTFDVYGIGKLATTWGSIKLK